MSNKFLCNYKLSLFFPQTGKFLSESKNGLQLSEICCLIFVGLICLAFAACSGGASSSTASTTVAPVASFSFSPGSPTAGQVVTFTDTSTGNPTSWSWSFGDTSSGTSQNHTHTYSTAATYTVSLTATNAAGSNTVSHTVTISAAVFDGTIVLGSPTTTSIKANVFSSDQSGTVYLAYGTATGSYPYQTDSSALATGVPLKSTLANLSANTQYYYRLYYQASGVSGFSASDEYTFHTARPAGSTFTFTIQADSHLDGESNLDLYHQTLANVLADAPDFHIDLGDTFMCEKFSEPLTDTILRAQNEDTVIARYVYERANFGLISHSVPLFLVNGNHEGEQPKIDTETNLIAYWASDARQLYYMNPVPDSFYTGDSTEQRASWYTWQWGDAQFIVLDPYWNSYHIANTETDKNWQLTLGPTQYTWLENTLKNSTATFKFVFVHNLVGGFNLGDTIGNMRGGIEAAPLYEWGGYQSDGTTFAFASERPGLDMPIHQLLKLYGVTAVFHGHDHLYDKQDLDGIAYLEVPQPSTRNSSSGPGLAAQYGYTSGTILSSSGHIRVTVSPTSVKAEYVRAWLPADETAQKINGQVSHTWTKP